MRNVLKGVRGREIEVVVEEVKEVEKEVVVEVVFEVEVIDCCQWEWEWENNKEGD